MIKKISLIFMLILLPTQAWSFSCPSLMAKIDKAIYTYEPDEESILKDSTACAAIIVMKPLTSFVS